MIVFVVALQSEGLGLINKLEHKTKIDLLDKPCYEGYLASRKVVVAISGIGKVSAALTTQRLIDTYNPKLVINFGTCGGIDKSIDIASYYLINKACQFDFDVTEIDDVSIGYIQEYDRVFFDTFIPEKCQLKQTALASADRFSNQAKDIETIAKLGCLVRDMEGGAIAQVCQSNNTPLVMIKGVTDVYGFPASQFMENLKKVCDGFCNIIESVVNILD